MTEDIEVEEVPEDEGYECGHCHQWVEPDWVAGRHVCFTEGWDGPLVGQAVKVLGSGGVAWRVDHHSVERAEIVAHMIGDNRPSLHDTADVTVISDEDFCSGCGSTDCTADGR